MQMTLIEVLEQQIAEFDHEIATRIARDDEEPDADQQQTSASSVPVGVSEEETGSLSFPIARQGLEGYAKSSWRRSGSIWISFPVTAILPPGQGYMAQRNRKVVYALNWLLELVNRKHKKEVRR